MTRFLAQLTQGANGQFFGLTEHGPVGCLLGKDGVVAASDKKEGDHCSPAGFWPFLEVLYRPDRLDPPKTILPTRALSPDDGWSDDVNDPKYNAPVSHPHPYSAEKLWRDDGLYDVIVVLGQNINPTIAGAGSAIFLHCKEAHTTHTEGCIALDKAHVLALLELVRSGDGVEIRTN